MINNNKLKLLIPLFLPLALLFSKKMIIYNEELLVGVTFFAFVVLISHYFGNTVKESLDERSKAIKQELQQFLLLKKAALTQIFKQYDQVSLLKAALSSLYHFTKKQVEWGGQKGIQALSYFFWDQIKQRVSNLSLSSAPFQALWQEGMADKQLPFLLVGEKQQEENNQNSPLSDSKITEKMLQLVSQFDK